jgi:hypothetical protein
MSTNFKTFLRRFEVAISLTILIIACQQFSMHQQNQQPTFNLLHSKVIK